MRVNLVVAAIALASSAFCPMIVVTAQASEPAHGVIVDTTNPRSMQLAREAGFTHAKMMLQWPRVEPKRGRYTWADTRENDLDNLLKAANAEEMSLVLRVDGVPDWAGGSPAGANLDAVASFYEAIATYARGRVAGYEILNEPNLPFEWGGPPSASAYTAYVKAAYRGVKRGDPDALVLAGGLSPAAEVDDLEFLRGMYAAGLRGNMDALAAHNYGGNFEPEADPAACQICFRRNERYRQIMVDAGDAKTPIWSTEFGWLLDGGKHMGQYDWMRVSAERQAEYIVRAYRYGRANWPWLGGLLLSNLDASTSPYHTGPQDGMPWFAILNKDHSPRAAYKAFKRMREEDTERAAASAARSAAAPPSAPSATPPAATVPEIPPLVADTSAVVSTAAADSSPGAPPAADPPSTSTLKVARTDGAGLVLRAEPSPTGRRIKLLPEGVLVETIGPDQEVGGRVWKNVRDRAGAAGWVAAQYLAP